MPRTTITTRKIVNYNLLDNGEFESVPTFVGVQTSAQRWIDGTVGGSTTNDLYKWGVLNSGGTISCQFDPDIKYSGTNSLKISGVSAGSYIQVHRRISSTEATIRKYGTPVLPSTSYTLTYWMKTELVSGDAATGASLAISQRNAANTQTASSTGTIRKITTDWTQYTITFTTHANTRFIDIALQVLGNAGAATLIMNAWFDEIVLKPTTGTVRTTAGTRSTAGTRVAA